MYTDVYRPLRTPYSTRLLKLLPGVEDSPLETELFEVDLNDGPGYDAISYTWGTDTRTKDVFINGTLVGVRYNLLNALLQFRRNGHSMPLWTDALSIDQTNTKEKSRQVAMIGDIFRNALVVQVWVGTQADNSESLFEPWLCPPHVCPVVPPAFQNSTINSKLWPLFNKHIPISPRQQLERFQAWHAFLQRPYWKRLWIIQEAILAKSMIVHCGSSSLPWQGLINARTQPWMDAVFDGIELDKLVGYSQPQGNPITDGLITQLRTMLQLITQIDCLRHQRSAKGVAFVVHFRHAGNVAYANSTLRAEAYDVAHLNILFPQSECYDKRDYIYGLLAVEKNEDFKKELYPDYEISHAEVFVKACQARFHTSNKAKEMLGYLSGLEPESRKREFVETMAPRLLDSKTEFESAVEIVKDNIHSSANKQERKDLEYILTNLKLSKLVQGWGIGGMEMDEKERKRLDKSYNEYQKRRQKMQA